LVAESFRVTPHDLVRGGTGSLRMPRQVAMYLARRTKATFAEIAAGFEGEHSTVVHAVKRSRRAG
jgi:chromosomal replication initiation ATPase DnaA